LGPSPYPILPSFEASISEVTTLLNEVDSFTATGPDGIPPKLLKELANKLSHSLTLLFNTSLNQGCLPHDWKIALIIPLFKKGYHNNCTI